MKKIVLLLSLLSISFVSTTYAQSPKIQAYIQQYEALAVSEMIRTGVPASITLAQGILESGYGESTLAKKSNNHFGIKCKSEWEGAKTYHDDDTRDECFRVYPTAEASYRDHSNFLKNRPYYHDLFSLNPRDYKAWAYGLKKAGYATERKYPQHLIRLIESYHLEQYSEIALNEMQHPGARYAQNGGSDGTSGKTALNKSRNDPKPGSLPAPPPASNNAPTMRVAQTMVKPPAYPVAAFKINGTSVVYAAKGRSLIALAASHHLNFHKLLEINNLDKKSVLSPGQLIFLDKKPKKGNKEFHICAYGETLKDISQKEGVALKSLKSFNKRKADDRLAAGERVYLRDKAKKRPKTL